mmetsp:Transcript_41120/g.89783  ORF Transcript_41120/g.89783 Transcript_41120/m.89783 type:complete len:229 (+) Transcript_41120:383-1069(+)
MTRHRPPMSSLRPIMTWNTAPGIPKKGPQTFLRPKVSCLFAGWPGINLPRPAMRLIIRPRSVPITMETQRQHVCKSVNSPHRGLCCLPHFKEGRPTKMKTRGPVPALALNLSGIVETSWNSNETARFLCCFVKVRGLSGLSSPVPAVLAVKAFCPSEVTVVITSVSFVRVTSCMPPTVMDSTLLCSVSSSRSKNVRAAVLRIFGLPVALSTIFMFKETEEPEFSTMDP